MDRVYVVGAGQETRTVANILWDRDSLLEVVILVERGFGEIGSKYHAIPILGYSEALREMPVTGLLVFADVNPIHRQHAATYVDAAKLEGRFWRFKQVCSPHASVASSVKLGKGGVIFPGAVLMDGVEIGDHVFIGPNVVVGAESRIGDYASLLAGAVLGEKSYVGMGGICGLGSIVPPGKRVGAWSQVTEGFLLRKDLAPGMSTMTRFSLKL